MTFIFDHQLIDLKNELNEELMDKVVQLDLHQFGRPWTRKKWAEAFRDENKTIFALLNQDDEPLGFTLWQLSTPDNLAHLLKIHIEQEHRRRGLGFFLLERSQEALSDLGMIKFYLEVEKDNIVAVRLYESLNYKVVHSKIRYYDDGKDALFMMRST
jgi:ribosomal protein S18 acetylase RimI-like enzyme